MDSQVDIKFDMTLYIKPGVDVFDIIRHHLYINHSINYDTACGIKIVKMNCISSDVPLSDEPLHDEPLHDEPLHDEPCYNNLEELQDNLIPTNTCIGCIYDQPNQLAHMEPGGCLYESSPVHL
jgi:hypothetical protein